MCMWVYGYHTQRNNNAMDYNKKIISLLVAKTESGTTSFQFVCEQYEIHKEHSPSIFRLFETPKSIWVCGIECPWNWCQLVYGSIMFIHEFRYHFKRKKSIISDMLIRVTLFVYMDWRIEMSHISFIFLNIFEFGCKGVVGRILELKNWFRS